MPWREPEGTQETLLGNLFIYAVTSLLSLRANSAARDVDASVRVPAPRPHTRGTAPLAVPFRPFIHSERNGKTDPIRTAVVPVRFG